MSTPNKRLTGCTAFLSIFLSLVMVPALASEGGDGGGGGGRDKKEPKNTEAKSPPSGFSDRLIAIRKKIYRMPLMHPLGRKGCVSITHEGNDIWEKRASARARKSWEENLPTAYAVLLQTVSKVVQSSPSLINKPPAAAAEISERIASALWARATQMPRSIGKNVMHGYDTAAQNAAHISTRKLSVRMRNIASN